MKRFLLLFLLFLVGCGDNNIGNEEIQSPLTRHEAEIKARTIALQLEGHIGRVTGETMSMGDGVSHNSWLIFIKDWDNTRVGDVIIAWHGERKLIHQVISRTSAAMRTKGTNNATADPDTVYEKDYLGTLIGQIYYRKDLTN